ncbi:MAG TPA: VOC family protein [Thermoanaerobaculia bacterium]|jgi:predicted enzyme related to lactoylglutathione lyase|nr:VOC family protein [Thermoanaerobaculia bacterium]
MTKVTQHAPGTFSWIELATTDVDGAKRFYTELFGLTASDTTAPPGDMVYSILKQNGRDVGGVYRLMEQMQAPPNWMPYITVENVDAMWEKAQQLGAEGGPDPMEVMEMGRMAILRDPVGAHFALWQPNKHIGSEVVNEHGTLAWCELQSPDREKALRFYTSLFGWTAKVSPEYVELVGAAGGMRDVKEGPAHWLIYFMVNDVDAIAGKTEQLGGGVLMPPMDIPKVGRMAVLRDPQGAAFALFGMS